MYRQRCQAFPDYGKSIIGIDGEMRLILSEFVNSDNMFIKGKHHALKDGISDRFHCIHETSS